MASAATRSRKRTRCTYKECRKLAPPGRKRCDGHKPGARRPADSRPANRKLTGRTEPRLFTKPLRPLTRLTTRGYEVIDFAEMIGEPLLPWQQFAVIHALELRPDGRYRFRTVLIIVARQNGKSTLKRTVTLWRMYMDGAREIAGAAQDVRQARKQWQLCQDTIHACPELGEEWGGLHKAPGDEKFWASGACYSIMAANERAGRGGSNDEVNIDELRTQKNWKAWSSLSKTINARPNGQVWAMSNAGDDDSVVLNQLRDSALAARDDSICILEWSAPDGCELDDAEAWRQANPSLGYGLMDADSIRSQMATDTPAVFRTEVLCQRVRQLEPGAIDMDAWEACADSDGTMDALRDRICAVADVAADGKHVTLAVAALLDDGRPRIEVADSWGTPAEAASAIPALLERIRPAWFGWIPSGPAAEMAPLFRSLAKKYNSRLGRPSRDEAPAPPADGEIKGLAVGEACQGLAGLVKGRGLVHSDDPMLNGQAAGSRKLWSGDSWRFTRRLRTDDGTADRGHVDGLYAAGGAVQAALTLPAPRRARIRMLA